MALFWSACIFTLVMALLPHPPQVPGHFSDKVQHSAAFATLGFLGRLAYPRVGAFRLIAALSFYGALIELLQAIPALHRDSDPLDWVADTIASTVVVLALHKWAARKPWRVASGRRASYLRRKAPRGMHDPV